MTEYDLLILGSGPGGYVAAIRAAQLGMKVGVVEKDAPGGVCLNWGCIPTKALLKSANYYRSLKQSSRLGISPGDYTYDWGKIIQRSRLVAGRLSKGVELLFKKNGVEIISGFGELKDLHTIEVQENSSGRRLVKGKKLIIAIGARPRVIPGMEFDGEVIISSKEAMSLEKQPASLLIVGAGAIGVEFAYFYSAFGTRVTLVEMLPQILPVEDEEIAVELKKALNRMGIKIYTSTKVDQLLKRSPGVVAHITQEDGISLELTAEKALVAIGVQPNSEGSGLENLSLELNRGWIKTDRYYRTSVEDVYAIGDIIGPPWLAHVASAEGIVAVEHIAGLNPEPLNYDAIPGCTYCQPQVASVGYTEKQARELGIDIRIGRFPFSANGKAVASNEIEGFVKLIFEAESERLLGAHILGVEATEMIAELALAVRNRLGVQELLKTIHAHPTLTEAVVEAAEAAVGHAIHI